MGVCNLSARMLVTAATLVLVSVLSVEGAPVASPSNWWSSYITDYLPPTIQKLVNDTIDQGTDVVYDHIKEEVIDKSADNIGKITYTLNAMMGRLNDISDKVDTIMTRRKLTKKEMLEVQERVAELESEIAQDKFNDELINDDVEKMIQMFLTSVREMMIQWNNEDAMFFNNVKSIEEQFYNFNKVVADGSGDLKTEIKKLFETMRNIDLSKIGALEDAKDNDEDDEIPRKF